MDFFADAPAIAWTIVVIAGLFALQYVLGPVLIRYTQTMRASPGRRCSRGAVAC